MRRLVIGFALLWSSLLTSGCWYFESGKWEDDPKNWERAWGSPKPADIVMPHSWYRRFRSRERKYVYFFQIQWNEKLYSDLINNNGMIPVDLDESHFNHPSPGYCVSKPTWFAPPSKAGYESWYSDLSSFNWLFREIKTNELFIYVCAM